MYLHSDPHEPFFDVPAATRDAVELIPLSEAIRLSGNEHFGEALKVRMTPRVRMGKAAAAQRGVAKMCKRVGQKSDSRHKTFLKVKWRLLVSMRVPCGNACAIDNSWQSGVLRLFCVTYY